MNRHKYNKKPLQGRVLGALLALVMVFALVPAPVFAADGDFVLPEAKMAAEGDATGAQTPPPAEGAEGENGTVPPSEESEQPPKTDEDAASSGSSSTEDAGTPAGSGGQPGDEAEPGQTAETGEGAQEGDGDEQAAEVETEANAFADEPGEGPVVSSVFGGVTLSGAEDDDAISLVNTSALAGHTLEVQAAYTPNDPDSGVVVTERKLIVTLAAGMNLVNAPGLVKNDDTWQQGDLSGTGFASAEYVQDAPIVLTNGTVRPGSGRLVYTFRDDSAVSGFSAVLAVGYDNLYLANTKVEGKTIRDAIAVQAVETRNGELHASRQDVLERFVVTGRGGLTVGYGNGGVTNQTRLPGDAVEMNFDLRSTIDNFGSSPGTILYDGAEIQMQLPKGLVVDSSPANIAQVVQIPAGSGLVTAFSKTAGQGDESVNTQFTITETPEGNTLVTLSVWNLMSTGPDALRFALRFKVDETLAPEEGNDIALTVTYPRQNIIRPYGGFAEGPLGTGVRRIVYVTRQNQKLAIGEPLQKARGIAFTQMSPDHIASGDLQYLGAYGIKFQSTADSGAVALRLDFTDTPQMAVRALRLPVGYAPARDAEGKLVEPAQYNKYYAYNLRVKVSGRDDVIEIPVWDRGQYSTGYELGANILFDLADVAAQYGIAPQQSIEWLEYTTQGLKSGYGDGSGHITTSLTNTISLTALFGHFTARPHNMDVVYNVSTQINPDITLAAADWQNYHEGGWNTTPVSYKAKDEQSVTFQAFNTPATGRSYQSGGTIHFNDIQFRMAYSSSGMPAPNGTVPTAFYVQGADIYLREMQGFRVKTGTIVIKDQYGNAYSGYSVQRVEGSNGESFVKVSSPKFRMGFNGSPNLSATRNSLRVSYDLGIDKNAKSGVYPYSEFMFVTPSDTDNIAVLPTTNANYVPFHAPDAFGLLGGEGRHFATMDARNVVTVQRVADVSLNTAGQMKYTGSNFETGWVSYDENDEDTILGFNPFGTGSYRLVVENHSGGEAGNFVAHVPIPKRGGEFGTGGSVARFKWSAAMEGPVRFAATHTEENGNQTDITGNAEVRVLYSTSYVASTGTAAGFEEWNAENAAKYKTVRIESAKDLQDGDVYTFAFGLGIAETSEDLQSEELALPGRMNVYGAYISYKTPVASYTNRQSEPVALRLDTGVIKGRVYTDADYSGNYSDGDAGYAGAVVNAYARRAGVEANLGPIVTSADGTFVVPGLAVGEEVRIEVLNPGHSGDTMRFADCAESSQPGEKRTVTVHASGAAVLLEELDIGLVHPYAVRFDPKAPAGSSAGVVQAICKYKGEQIEAADLPQVAQVTGYAPISWKQAGGDAAPTGFVVNEPVTFEGVWTKLNYPVTFVVAGGTAPAATTADHGDRLDRPAAADGPEGHSFDGWYRDEGYETPWNFSTDTVTDALTLYGRWVRSTYTVTFEGGAGATGVPAPYRDVAHGSTIAQPASPAREGYIFRGWYGDEAREVPWNFETGTVTGDTMLYAKFVQATHAVAYVSEGRLLHTRQLAAGERVPEVAPPQREGHTFLFWREQGGAAAWNFEGQPMPARDLTLEAVWERDSAHSTAPVPPGGSSSGNTGSPVPLASSGGAKAGGSSTASPAAGGAVGRPPSSTPGMGSGATNLAGNPAQGTAGPPPEGKGEPVQEPALVGVPDALNPLAAANNTGAWALLNLLVAVGMALGSVLLLVDALRRGRKARPEEGKPPQPEESEADTGARKCNPVWRALGMLAGFAAVLTFVLADLPHMAQPMVTTNRWTPLMLLYLALHVAAWLVARRRKHPQGKAPRRGETTPPKGA